jgi:D-beta-D-heptose 7-phosphate kinase/D-beta-D-heptose 1-phosphate adenosyltransferase
MNPPQKQFNVILIGDKGLDEYVYGLAERLSPEAPVPVFVPKFTESKPGMAANVHSNLINLGLNVTAYYAESSKKSRIIDVKSKQHIVRIDNDIISNPLTIDAINLEKIDAIIISDYNKGTVSYELCEALRSKFSGPIFIDTKKQELSRFNGCFVKINQLEYNARHSKNDKLIVTLGGNGAMYETDNDRKYYNSVNVEVADVCGAGDTFLAALAYQYLQTNDIDSAIEFAIKASAITVQHIGVYAPKLEEIV